MENEINIGAFSEALNRKVDLDMLNGVEGLLKQLGNIKLTRQILKIDRFTLDEEDAEDKTFFVNIPDLASSATVTVIGGGGSSSQRAYHRPNILEEFHITSGSGGAGAKTILEITPEQLKEEKEGVVEESQEKGTCKIIVGIGARTVGGVGGQSEFHSANTWAIAKGGSGGTCGDAWSRAGLGGEAETDLCVNSTSTKGSDGVAGAYRGGNVKGAAGYVLSDGQSYGGGLMDFGKIQFLTREITVKTALSKSFGIVSDKGFGDGLGHDG